MFKKCSFYSTEVLWDILDNNTSSITARKRQHQVLLITKQKHAFNKSYKYSVLKMMESVTNFMTWAQIMFFRLFKNLKKMVITNKMNQTLSVKCLYN